MTSLPTLPCLLVVDDDPLILELVTARLQSEGFSVTTAVNGADALDLLKSLKPALIVCDVVMPKVDGLSLCRQLRSQGNTTPILFLTAKGQPHDIVELLSTGADDYLVKPFESRELSARIKTILRRTTRPEGS